MTGKPSVYGAGKSADQCTVSYCYGFSAESSVNPADQDYFTSILQAILVLVLAGLGPHVIFYA